jgi:hypothetical protein
LIVLFSPSRVLGKTVDKVVAEVQCPILQQFCTCIMSFQDGYFKGIETFPIHSLQHPNLHEELDYFHVSICSSIVQKRIVTIISFVVSLKAVEDLEENVILVITNSNHQRCPSIIVRLLRVKTSIKQVFDQIFLPISCSYVENI